LKKVMLLVTDPPSGLTKGNPIPLSSTIYL